MAVVNLRLSSQTTRKALDDMFNDGTITNYKLSMTYNGTVVGTTQNCSFKNAVYDSTNKLAYVELDTAVWFATDPGDVINGILLTDDTPVTILTDTITERTYTNVGTYTVSNLIVKLGG